MRIDIRYMTRFRYAAPVTESQNELRAAPANDERQQLMHYHVTTAPSSRVASYVDYWGTRVDTFGIRPPHTQLEVVAEATVETVAVSGPAFGGQRSALENPAFRDEHFALLQRSPHTGWGREITTAASKCAEAAGNDTLELAMAVHDYVAGFEYRPGATYVGVDVDEVHRAGGGVCQDFAHLAIAMYRALGVPARYVSGYLFTVDDATGTDAIDDEVEVQTHAWVEVALPAGGWLALDPTNSQPVGERHVAIGRGRDYDDVAPLRGVYSGDASHEMDVSVVMRRLAREPHRVGQGLGSRTTQQQQQQQ